MAIFERIEKRPWGIIAIFSETFEEFPSNQKSLTERIKNMQGYGLSTDEEQKAQVAMAAALDAEKK